MFHTSEGDRKAGVAALLKKRRLSFKSWPATSTPPFYRWWCKDDGGLEPDALGMTAGGIPRIHLGR